LIFAISTLARFISTPFVYFLYFVATLQQYDSNDVSITTKQTGVSKWMKN